MELGSEAINIVISLCLSSIVFYALYAYHKHITSFFNDTLVRNANRMFANPSVQPLYKIFYKFNHANTKAWVAWMQRQPMDTINDVFSNLVDYLSQDPKDQGLVIQEIVKAIIYFEHEHSFKALKIFIENGKTRWGQYKAIKSTYENAAFGLMELDSEKGQEVLMDEICAHVDDSAEEYKIHLVNALDIIEDDEVFLVCLERIIVESPVGPKIKAHVLEVFDEREVDTPIKFLNDVIESLSTNKDAEVVGGEEGEEAENKDASSVQEVLNVCLEKLFNMTFEDEALALEVWEKAHELSKDPEFLGPAVRKVLVNKISDPAFEINGEYMLKIYENLSLSCQAQLKKVLGERFKLTEQELSIITELEEVDVLDQRPDENSPIMEVVNPGANFELPVFLKGTFEKLKKILQDEKISHLLKLVMGKVNVDKFILVKALAKELEMKLLILNADSLISAPDKQAEILKNTIPNEGVQFIYLYNCVELFKQISSNNPDELVKAMAEFLKKLANVPEVNLLIGLDLSTLQVKEEEPELHEYFDEHSEYKKVINLGDVAASERQTIYNQYEVRLDSARENQVESFDEVLYYTNNLSPYQFNKFILKFFAASLLTQGKLMSMHEYDSFLQKEEAPVEAPLVS